MTFKGIYCSNAINSLSLNYSRITVLDHYHQSAACNNFFDSTFVMKLNKPWRVDSSKRVQGVLITWPGNNAGNFCVITINQHCRILKPPGLGCVVAQMMMLNQRTFQTYNTNGVLGFSGFFWIYKRFNVSNVIGSIIIFKRTAGSSAYWELGWEGFLVQAPAQTKDRRCSGSSGRCRNTFTALPSYPWARHHTHNYNKREISWREGGFKIFD